MTNRFTESVVEEAALEWLGGLGYDVIQGPTIAPDQDGDLRIIDESGEDYLYPADRFMMLKIPTDIERALREAS